MLNPIKLFRIYRDLNQGESIAKEKAPMNTKVLQYAHLAVTLVGVIGVPEMANQWISNPHHLTLYAVAVAISAVLHAVSPQIFGGPSAAAEQQSGFSTKVGTKLGLVALFCLMGVPAGGQAQTASSTATATPTNTGVSASSGPAAVLYKGTWSAASLTREYFDFLDFGAKKGNHLSLQGVELAAPGPGVNLYMGGFSLRPDLGSLLAKTNVPPGALQFFVDANVGNGVPSSGGTHIAWMLGGGIAYKPSSTLSWQPLTIQYARFGATPFTVMSTQLQFIFGGAAK